MFIANCTSLTIGGVINELIGLMVPMISYCMNPKYLLKKFSLLMLIGFIWIPAQSQSKVVSKSLESVINRMMVDYPFTFDNQFKLSAYAELKGQFSARNRSVTLDFGNMGKLSFYHQNCLLRTPRGQVFYLNRKKIDPSQAHMFNRELERIFENIALLGNHGADPEQISFVNKWLARKNLEPFDKIFTRYLFVKYGKYDAKRRQVEFHTDWLGAPMAGYRDLGGRRLVRKHSSPLRVLLDSVNLRGYYLKVGGYVYVEDVKRKVNYATGEEYRHNVGAFKLFVKKLLMQTTQYVSRNEFIPEKKYTNVSVKDVAIANLHRRKSNRNVITSSVSTRINRKIKPLYSEYDWIPGMLGRLRAENINIGDPDIIPYFIGQPYFDYLYKMLMPKEKAAVDRYLRKRKR